MKYDLFATLYAEAQEYSNVEMYIAERGWQEWMDNYPSEQLGNILTSIYELATTSLKEIRESRKISRAAFSRVYNIPVRTLEDWDTEKRKITDYNKMLIAYTFFMNDFLDKSAESNKHE
ncbi:helix-turn-helix domain-containing protein [Enterococcus plantarum]|uniref:helix-turn-helix domain-containing protein n=1 Tax=Enterococcus TaxID=1350 RepID=UPI001A908764|nr:hypothetical protein [Enterococcus plantarum]MBO0423876.1 hypothetical protein [Enterococcus plantarum]